MAMPWLYRVAWAGLLLMGQMGAALRAAPAEAPHYPAERWPTRTPREAGLDELKLRAARDYALTGEGAGIIVYRGNVVLAWGDTKKRFDLKSTSKSIGVTALGLAMLDRKVKLHDKASALHPAFGVPPEENAKTGWLGEITLFHLATQTAGFDKPGGYVPLRFAPGTKWHYSDAGPNWLAECLTLAYRRDMHEFLTERVFDPIGITPADLTWRNNSYRPHEIEGIKRREFGSGVHANVDAMARIGYLYLRGGRWKDKQILPAEFVDACRTTPKELTDLPEHEPRAEHGDASRHYGLLWWNNNDGSLPGVPKDAYWSWGLYDSLIVVIPSLDLVVARAGKSWKREKGAAHYDVLKPFLGNIVGAIRAGAGTLPWKIRWAPPETIAVKPSGAGRSAGTARRAGTLSAPAPS